MIAAIQHSRVIHQPEPERRLPAARISIPDLRAEENVLGEIHLVAGPPERPVNFGICASHEVAERTVGFFGGAARPHVRTGGAA